MRILVSEEAIAQRIEAMAREIDAVYQDREITVIIMLNGAVIFAADLIRKLKSPLLLDSFACSSYINDRSSGEIHIRSELKLPVKGRNILLVDDIFDTGFTMANIRKAMLDAGAAEVRTCVLLNKNVAKKTCIVPDFIGFDIANEYVVGYGLDSQERFRNLPYIGVLDAD